jgi:hypothetical protein
MVIGVLVAPDRREGTILVVQRAKSYGNDPVIIIIRACWLGSGGETKTADEQQNTQGVSSSEERFSNKQAWTQHAGTSLYFPLTIPIILPK